MDNFKVGDWMTRSLASGGFIDFFDEQIPNFKVGDWVRNSDNEVFKLEDIHMWQDLPSLFTLWEPKQGEWCWFYPEEYPLSYILAKFDHYENALYWAHTEFSDRVEGFPCCEPFVGKLPSFIKELT